MDNQADTIDYFEQLLHFLGQPDAYPHKPDSVEHVQTHISHVFIAPPFVYKLKKPVEFGFLDYSTLEKRKKFCHRELELNRRLSDGVYLNVISIVRQNAHFRLLENKSDSENVVEYAVKMKQLSEEHFLHTYLENNALTKKHLDRLAGKLADFYNRQEPDNEILKWGEIENIKVNTSENFSQTKPFLGKTIDGNANEAIQLFTNQYLKNHASLFERRIEEKRIVDGHGDLHLEHIHITPNKVQIYDCIEFNERFRYGDLAVDLAFFAMDLNFNNCWQLERYFIDQMAQRLDDSDLPKILDFYKCYRAYVKGKVKSLQSTEDEVPKKERKKAAQLATQYFDLSLRYALLGSLPTVLVFMGRVGTGKSTLAQFFSDKLHIDSFSTDRIRKEIAGLPVEERSPASRRDELYSSKMSEKTYQRLFKHARDYLRVGQSVILDATFSSATSREKLASMLPDQSRILFIEVQTSDEIVKKRLKDRENESGVISDARLEDFEMLNDRYQSPEEIGLENLITVSTDHSPEDTVNKLYSKLVEQNMILLPQGR